MKRSDIYETSKHVLSQNPQIPIGKHIWLNNKNMTDIGLKGSIWAHMKKGKAVTVSFEHGGLARDSEGCLCCLWSKSRPWFNWIFNASMMACMELLNWITIAMYVRIFRKDSLATPVFWLT